MFRNSNMVFVFVFAFHLVLVNSIEAANNKEGKKGFFLFRKKRERAEAEARARAEQEQSVSSSSKFHNQKAKPVHSPRKQSREESQAPVHTVSGIELVNVVTPTCADVPTNIRNLVAKHLLTRKSYGTDSSDQAIAHQAAKMTGLLYFRSFHNAAEGFVNVWDKANIPPRVKHEHSFSSAVSGKTPYSRFSQVDALEQLPEDARSIHRGFGLGGMSLDRLTRGGYGLDNFKTFQGVSADQGKNAWEHCLAEDVFGEAQKKSWISLFDEQVKVLNGKVSSQIAFSGHLKNDPKTLKAAATLMSLCPQMNLSIMGREIKFGSEKASYFGGKAESSDWTKAGEVCFEEYAALLSDKSKTKTFKQNSPAEGTTTPKTTTQKKHQGPLKRFLSRLKNRKQSAGASSYSPTPSQPIVSAPTTAPIQPTTPPSTERLEAPAIPTETPATEALVHSDFILSSKAATGLGEGNVQELNSIFSELSALQRKLDSDEYQNKMDALSEDDLQVEYSKLKKQVEVLNNRVSKTKAGIDFNVHKTAAKDINRAQSYIDHVLDAFKQEGFQE